MLDDCYSLKERDKKGRIVEGNRNGATAFSFLVF